MAITATTLAGAVGANDTFINVASATGITAPNFQTASGITYLKIDEEYLLVSAAPNGTAIPVIRGQSGSGAVAHVVNTTVSIGLPSDFPPQQSKVNTIEAANAILGGMNLTAVLLNGTTDAIPAGVAASYVIKTGSADSATLGLPTLAQEGNIIAIQSDTAFAHVVTLPSAAYCHGLTAVHTIATFANLAGAGMILRCVNLRYHVLSQLGVTFS